VLNGCSSYVSRKMLVHNSLLQIVHEPSQYSIPFGIRQSDSTYGSSSRYQQATVDAQSTLSRLSILVLPPADRKRNNNRLLLPLHASHRRRRSCRINTVTALRCPSHEGIRGSRCIAPLIPNSALD